MANAITMADTDFEVKKNWKATSYTGLIVLVLLLIFIFWKWPLQTFATPILEEGIEVNLGNSDQGLGEDQAFLPGKPAPSDAQDYTPPAKAEPVKDEPVKDIVTDDKDDDAPEIKKPIVTKPDATKAPDKEPVKSKPVKNPSPVPVTSPPKPKPKAEFKGVNGDGSGGNEADNFKKGGNQGVAGGKGDQGKPGGDPDSKNYNGAGGNGTGAIRISKGLAGRKIVGTPSFEDDFNETATIFIDVKVDGSGRVTAATYQPKGSTSSAPNLKAIAQRKALQVKFSPSGEESFGTLVFNFKLKN